MPDAKKRPHRNAVTTAAPRRAREYLDVMLMRSARVELVQDPATTEPERRRGAIL
jgi:hypothetical protein